MTNIADSVPSISSFLGLKQSYKTPVKKDLMMIILLKTYEHLNCILFSVYSMF